MRITTLIYYEDSFEILPEKSPDGALSVESRGGSVALAQPTAEALSRQLNFELRPRDPDRVQEEVNIEYWLSNASLGSENSKTPLTSGTLSVINSSIVAARKPLVRNGTILSPREITAELASEFYEYSSFHFGSSLKTFISFRDEVCTTSGIFVLWYPRFTTLNEQPVKCCISFLEVSKEEIIILCTDASEDVRSLGESLSKSHQLYKTNPVEFFQSKV